MRIFFRKLLRLHVPECLYECNFASDDTNNFCAASDDKGFFVCTRKIGHKGNHVACGCEDHDIKIWR